MRYIIYLIILISIQMPSYSQQLIHTFEYDNSTIYRLQEQQGKMGLTDENNLLVPHVYDLVLPSITPGYSFVVRNDSIGVFDHRSQRVVVMTSEYPEIELFRATNDECYLIFKGSRGYTMHNTQLGILYGRQPNGLLEQIKVSYSDIPRHNRNRLYKNGIQRVDDFHYIHHASLISWEEVYGGEFGEEEVQYRFTKVIQGSGIFSLDDKRMVVDPSYAEVKIWMDGDQISSSDNFIDVTQYDLNEWLDDDWEEEVIQDPSDYVHYGLIAAEDFSVVMYPQSQPLHESLTGGFFKEVDSKPGLLEAYDSTGKLVFSKNDVSSTPESIIVVGNRIYLGFYSDNYNEVEIMVPNYHIYSLDGQFIKKESIYLAQSDIDEETNKASAAVLPTNYEVFKWGLYDLAFSSFVLEPIYDFCYKERFSTGLLKCEESLCNYYYIARNGEQISYYDQNLKSFDPEWAVKKPYEPINFDEINFWAEAGDDYSYDFYISEERTQLMVNKYYGTEKLDEYAAKKEAVWQDLIIISVLNDESRKLYGLIRSEESKFVLPPVFDDLKFDEQQGQLLVKLRNESGAVLLERYDR